MKLKIKKIGNPENPPMLFLHGFMGRGSDWTDIANSFSKNYHCLLLDLPGHGDSPIEVTNFNELGDIILKSIGTQKKITIMGYSMGGRIALYLILTYPHLFEKAIIESASPGIKSKEEREIRYQKDLNLLKDVKDLRPFLRAWYDNPLFGALGSIIETLIKKKLENDPKKLQSSLRAFSVGNQPNLWDKLQELSVPTLYISGNEDEKYTKIGQELEGLSLKINREVIQNCAHITHLQNPEKFKSFVNTFLSN